MGSIKEINCTRSWLSIFNHSKQFPPPNSPMEPKQTLKDHDLKCMLQFLQTHFTNFQTVSFYLFHSTCSCYQSSENSININLTKENNPYFPHLLNSLSNMEKDITQSWRTIQFHNVQWRPEYIRSLNALLGSHPRIEQIQFTRNSFGLDCLRELSEIMKTNTNVKEIVFCESGIGMTGTVLIASALRVNQGLQELQIWQDCIGLKGAEELSKMIEVNTSLKLLTIFDSSFSTAAPVISSVLARNREMEVHVWSSEKGENCSKVVEFVPGDGTLRLFNFDVLGACRVTGALGINTRVRTLDMSGVRLKSTWAREFRWVIEQNNTLKEVILRGCCLRDKAAIYISAGLFKNRCIEILDLDGNWFKGIGLEHLLCPLTRFSPVQAQANTALKSLTFGGGKTRIGRDGVEAIIQMMSTNQSLTRVGIHDDRGLSQDDVARILQSLHKNVSLKRLSLKGCRGVKGELVLRSIMDLLEVNKCIENIDLDETPLYNEGKTDEIYERVGKNTKFELEVDSFRDMPMVMPKSCRVFLCGNNCAGKSTLFNSISSNFSSTKSPYLDQVRSLVNPIDQVVKPEGIKIKTFKDGSTKISVWNLSGQHESCSLHDILFPGHGSASCFLIVMSLFRMPNNKEGKTPLEIEEELRYWLRFVVSNSKRAVQQCMLPNVTLVFTNSDKINHPSQNFEGIADSVRNMRDRFDGWVEFHPTVFTIDARSLSSVGKLARHIKNTSYSILERVPRVYEICNDLVQTLSDWRTENQSKPLMNWQEFGDLCQGKVPPLRVISRSDNKETRRKAVARCLHDIGEVIYYDDLGLLILDFEWFCDEVVGRLGRLSSRSWIPIEGGFVSRKEMEKILKINVVRMMLKVEICFEQNPGDSNSQLLIPSLLEDGRRKSQKWRFSLSDFVYAGRRLECDDSSRVFLTPGFFPRLQVHLHNKIMALKDQHGATCTLEKHLISIKINGIDVRVELGGQSGYYIDVLACSAKTLTETLRLVHQLIIPPIQTFSLSQGVLLIDSVIRPECVRTLTPPRYRKTQLLGLEKLKEALLSVPADSMYDYQHTWGEVTDANKAILGVGYDYARDLLSEDDFREVLRRRYDDLYNLANELQVSSEDEAGQTGQTDEEEHRRVDPSFEGIAKGVERVLQRLKIIEEEIRDLKQEIQGLRYYEHRLLIELHRKMDHLVNYSVEIEERKVPNMFFFVRTENYTRKLVTNIVSGLTALRLHMLCEFRREMHVVDGQTGCEVMQVDNTAVRFLAPYMTRFMKMLTFALKIGAHLATGMGQLIPDLSREVGRLLESPLATGAAGAAAAGAVGAMAMGSSGSRARHETRDIQQDQRAAQQWVVDFLRDRGCSSGRDIAEKFGLWRVRYRDSGQVAWVCRTHMTLRANQLIELPL